ncbi:hypothetical protein SAMN05444159_1902 [Bradyrhizobium lablabi]|uniref:Uncharacterized protein n=1 Tax=Bradyrhizobium lablabi TaxID=722472 RepID=A0A1M6N8Q0_9BRAD|nr:hypothetical protein SAMN05444159_1902 [Bradyrhizobium lablabi]
MMWSDELRLAQEDGGLPTTLAGGGAPANGGVSVVCVRFRDGSHFSGTTQQHLICLLSEFRRAPSVGGFRRVAHNIFCSAIPSPVGQYTMAAE